MYLHDYQKHTLDKLHGPSGSGGNFILHGPRQIGLSVIVANRALGCVGNMDTLINIISPNGRMSNFILNLVSDTLYAGKTSRVSTFDSSLEIKSRHNNVLTFTNGSRIKFMIGDNRGTAPWNAGDLGDIVIVENGNDIKGLPELLSAAQLCHQIIFTQTGGMDKQSELYKLHVDSVKGIYDFTYIRFPMEVAVPKQMERYEDMRVQLTPVEWVHDMEMIPYL